MQSKRLYIKTIGCQMNVYDSDQIAVALAPLGYVLTSAVESADLVIVNTCTIRGKAEQKAFSFLGRLAKIKTRNPSLIVAVGGCVAQQEGRTIPRRMPHVDLVFGTSALFRLPQMIRRVEQSRRRIVDIGSSNRIEFDAPTGIAAGEPPATAFVTIMRGCDNFCTYCVVPHVRGREVSRHPATILNEIHRRVDQGVREVTLLGQNVNSYGAKEGLCTFAALLERVNAIEGLGRIRFTTSHPKDLHEDLIGSFGRLEKLCHHIHLPVQSGSNEMLRRMNRRYTRDMYLRQVERLRAACPDIAITSDVIVGFPGETQRHFEKTLALVEAVQYDGLFAFRYSDRPNAPAAAFRDKIPQTLKKERLQELLARQQTITQKKYRAQVGQILRVLVEGPSRELQTTKKSGPNDVAPYCGRSSANHIVHFNAPKRRSKGKQWLTGAFADIMIEKAFAHSLWGRLTGEPLLHTSGKGGATIAA